jgi:hypothetical protein
VSRDPSPVTKCDNSHVRCLLVESVWHHVRPSSPTAEATPDAPLDVPADTVRVADKASRLLFGRLEHDSRTCAGPLTLFRGL